MTNRLINLATFILKFRNKEDKKRISTPIYFDKDYKRVYSLYLQSYFEDEYSEHILFTSYDIVVKLCKFGPTWTTGDLVISGLGKDEQKIFSDWVNGRGELYNEIIQLDI